VSSRSLAGTAVSELFPALRGICDLAFAEPDSIDYSHLDLVFFATPHGVAQNMMAATLDKGVRVIDLSADFRLRDVPLWEKVYKTQHAAPELVASAVYGLPEINRAKIAGAQLVACPGCYPTSVALGFLPLIEAGLVDLSTLIASCASGVSGAGRQAKMDFLLTECSESFKAYGASGHRHQPEIEQILRDNIPGGAEALRFLFVPHLAPMIRGMHSTLFADLTKRGVDLQALFEQRYADEPCVDVMPAGSHPETRSVRGANLCRLAVYERDGRALVLSVIDNLTKGASGQAVQNMNIMFGLDETMGLKGAPLVP
jgi:N-acetyl-gamma-glutamyl-phosphate reductase